jgi:hypothetical protein
LKSKDCPKLPESLGLVAANGGQQKKTVLYPSLVKYINEKKLKISRDFLDH